MAATLRSEDQIGELIPEAAASAHYPELHLHDNFADISKTRYPALSPDHLQAQEPIVEREFGDDFAFSVSLRLQVYAADDQLQMEETVRSLHTINLNLFLAHAQTAPAEAWQCLLLQVVPYLQGDAAVRPHPLLLANSLSRDLASERRSGG